MQQYPALNSTEQRIADQRRAIIAINLLPPDRLLELRVEVTAALNSQPLEQENGANILQTEDACRIPPPPGSPESEPDDPGANEDSERRELDTNAPMRMRLVEGFQTALTEQVNINPLQLPFIAKQNWSAKLAAVVKITNENILPHQNSNTFEEVHASIQVADTAIVRAIGGKVFLPSRDTKIRDMPSWETRITLSVEQLRCNIGRVQQYMAGNRSKAVLRNIRLLEKKVGYTWLMTHQITGHKNSQTLSNNNWEPI